LHESLLATSSGKLPRMAFFPFHGKVVASEERKMSARRRRRCVEPTEDWEQLAPLLEWPEQERYEEIRPLVLFGESVAERAGEGGTSASALYRRMDRFGTEGMEGLFGAEKARRRRLPPAMRRLIVDTKSEHPPIRERRMAVVSLHSWGWAPKSIASYLKLHKSTVYRVLKRWYTEAL
jgi:hypothetical protein